MKPGMSKSKIVNSVVFDIRTKRVTLFHLFLLILTTSYITKVRRDIVL